MSDTIGTEVRRARERRRMTQAELARLVECDVGHISRIERGSVWPSKKMLEKIGEACNCHFVMTTEEP